MSSAESERNKLTRREFVRGSVVGGAAGLVVGAGANASAKPGLPKKWDYEADVVVIGTGFAGENAAIASHDLGAKVLVLEKAPEKFAGGNSGVSGGGITIPSNIPEAVKLYRALCFGTVPDQLAVDMAEAIAKIPENFKKIGIEVAANDKRQSSVSPTSYGVKEHGILYQIFTAFRIHGIVLPKGSNVPTGVSGGRQLYLALNNCMTSRGIKILYETPAKKLIQDPETKAIVGVVAEGNGKSMHVKAKRGVVLACGGYETNREMLQYYNYPALRIYQWGTPYNTGDGIKMAADVGAFLWHLNSIEWAGTSLKQASEQCGVSVQANTGSGAARAFIYANKYGKRFMNELKNLGHNKGSLELSYFSHEQEEYPNNPFYLVFDETLRAKAPLSRTGGMTWNGTHGLYKWSADNKAEIEKGWIVKGDTVKELAAKIPMDAAGLEATLAKYNEYCGGGKDPEFGRPKESLLPIKNPPYYATELALTCINTQGGPKHNGKAQTLNTDDRPIPRLYSAGELGSFFGFIYPGGSNIAEAIAFGRIAGENAAAEKPWK